MRVVYVRCMDGHYFAVRTSAQCPLDGSAADFADAVLNALPAVVGDLTLAALQDAGVSAAAGEAILVVEAVDGAALPDVLQPS